MRLFLLSILIIVSVGCSNANLMTPTDYSNSSNTLNVPIIGASMSESHFEALGVLGEHSLTIDPVDITAELISKRFGAIGESYIVSGTSFFTMTPCSDCLKIKKVALTPDNKCQLTFGIRHPFKPGNPAKPPTAVNRLDLDVFDLALLVLPKETAPQFFNLTGAKAYSNVITNSDGYTTELANVIGDSSALPYVLIIDDNADNANTYNEFPMGGSKEFDVIFNINSGTQLTFDLYLTMGYGASAKKADRLNPRYYNPEFNRKSAWKIKVIPPEGNNPPQIGNTWQNNDSTTLYNVRVEVFDWQIGANVNPNLTEQTDIYAASDVSSVSVEIPGMTNTLPSVTTPVSGTGSPNDPLIYNVPIANQNLLGAGQYIGLVKVTDSRVPGTSVIGGETDTLAHTPDGILIRWYNIPEFATYQTFTATVVIGCGPIIGSITTPICPLTGLITGSSINFSAVASSFNGGDPIVLYEWDKDYDGIPSHFSVDATGQNVTLGPFVNQNCGTPPETPVTYTVAVRAKDSCNPPNVTIFATCQVTVNICTPPLSIGNLTIKVNRTGANYIINASAPFTLSWTAPQPGIPEYAIYKDPNPSDGLTNNLEFVATTTSTTWTDTVSIFPTNRYIVGWTYIVRARATAGVPSSEGPDSEPAFVTTNGWETLSLWQNGGEGWTCNQETTYSAYYNRPYVFGTATYNYEGVAQGEYCVRSSPFCGGNYMSYAGRWNGLVKQTPTVPNSTVRFLDFSLYIYQMYAPQGMIIGTCAYAPSLGWSNTQDLEWASAKNTDGYWGYNTDSSDAKARFGNVPDGTYNAWINGTTTDRRKLVGGDVNIDGNPNHPFVGIEWVKLDSYYVQQYPFIDELAIVIY